MHGIHKIFLSFDFNGNRINNVGLEMLDIHPLNELAYTGRIYYNTTDNIIYYKSETDWIGLTESKTKIEHLSDITIGSINAGDITPIGSTLDSFITQLTSKTFTPTYVAPSLNLIGSGITSTSEIGTIANIVLTANFNRGSIVGKTVNSIWQPSTFQNYRSGIANNYTIDSIDLDLVNTLTKTNYQILSGANTFSALVNYDIGIQPVNSKNENFETPLSAGSVSANVTFYGYNKLFYGTDSVNNVTYTLSSEIRALVNSILNPLNGTTFTINIPAGAKMVTISYPAYLEDISSIKHVEGLNAEIKSVFNKTLINVERANNYLAISYKVYTYIPVSPYENTATYSVTI